MNRSLQAIYRSHLSSSPNGARRGIEVKQAQILDEKHFFVHDCLNSENTKNPSLTLENITVGYINIRTSASWQIISNASLRMMERTAFWWGKGTMPNIRRSSLCKSRNSAVNSVKKDSISCSSTTSSLLMSRRKIKFSKTEPAAIPFKKNVHQQQISSNQVLVQLNFPKSEKLLTASGWPYVRAFAEVSLMSYDLECRNGQY